VVNTAEKLAREVVAAFGDDDIDRRPNRWHGSTGGTSLTPGGAAA
jgi:hypothetical protein